MSKLIPLLFAGAGTATLSVGGFYLVKGSGAGISDGSPNSSAVPATGTTVQNLEFDTVEAFKGDMKKSACVKEYFGEILDKSDAPDISASSPESTSFFKTPASETYKSCLFINGKITSYQDDKWNGKLTWLWTFMSGDEGFITFNVAESSTEHDGKLKFSGVFYLVGKKNDDNQKGEIKHKKNMDNKEADKDSLDTNFPKAANELKGGDGDYWGFVVDSSKLEKSCKATSCGSTSTSSTNPKFISRRFSFAKAEGKSKKPHEGSSGLDGGNSLYNGINGSLSEKVQSFSGEWAAQAQ